jgi:hypothetical protein
MRFIKVILIILSISMVALLIYTLYGLSTFDAGEEIPTAIFATLSLLLLLSIGNVIYHFKSFRFYRRSEKQRLESPLHKLIWVAGFGYPGLLFFLFSIGIYNNSARYYSGAYNPQDLFIIILLISLGSLEFLETSLLKRRIKRLKIERDSKNEISDIGNTSS